MMQKPSARHAKILVQLGVACARFQAKPDPEEYEIVRQAALELGFKPAPLGSELPRVPDEAWFAGPAATSRRAFHRIGVLSFALFLLAPETHEGAAGELKTLFNEQGLPTAGLARYVDDLVVGEPGEAFQAFLRHVDSVVDTVLGKQGGNEAPMIASLDELETTVTRHLMLRSYYDDLSATISELKICVAQDCAIASLALCGKLVELALKLVLQSQRVAYDDTATMAGLLKHLKEKCPKVQLDPSMPEVARLIDQSRIPSVQHKLKVAVPTGEQVAPVVTAATQLLSMAITLAAKS